MRRSLDPACPSEPHEARIESRTGSTQGGVDLITATNHPCTGIELMVCVRHPAVKRQSKHQVVRVADDDWLIKR